MCKAAYYVDMYILGLDQWGAKQVTAQGSLQSKISPQLSSEQMKQIVQDVCHFKTWQR